MNRDDLKTQLIEYSRKTGSRSRRRILSRRSEKLENVFGDADENTTAAGLASGDNGSLESLIKWMSNELNSNTEKEDLSRMNRERVKTRSGRCRRRSLPPRNAANGTSNPVEHR